MKNIFVLLLMAAVAFCAYKAYTSGVLQKNTQARTGGVVRQVVRNGKSVGEGAGKAFRSVDFGGR